jgi:diguanylate cyclase (GGDEF)-like protein
LRKVQHLIELSHVHEQEKFRQRTGAKLKRWSGEFTSLDLDSTFSTTASFLQREFSASGVIWIPIARIKEINDSFPKNGEELFQPHPAAFENLQVWSDRESIDWVALLSDWHTHQSFDGRKKPSHPWSFQREREMDVIIPITDICDKQLVGFLVLVDAQGWNVFVDDSFLEEVMNILCRQWSFCRDFESVSLKVFCDDLTPLYNQRYLPVVLQQELVRSNRTTEPFSVLFMDIDYFKQVNDTLGHLVGSRVLVSLSRVLLDSLRGTDFGFRYGGDEFVAVLSGTGQDGAKFLAERLRNKVENTVFEELGHKVRITVSVGVATYPHHASSVAEVLWMADQAMYSGKNSGRNTVYIAS